MKNTLIDAGPVIALFDRSDKYHKKVKEWVENYKGIFTTTWPVITEVSYMLNFNIQTQIDFFIWLSSGGAKIENIEQLEIARIIELSRKYSDVPMDLADASLVVVAERLELNEIVSIDSDFYIYRTKYKEMLTNVLEKN